MIRILLSAFMISSALAVPALPFHAIAQDRQAVPSAQQDAQNLMVLYEQWLPLAEALGQARAERNFERALRLELDPTADREDLDLVLRQLDQHRKTGLRAVFTGHDPRALITEAPQTANFLTQVVRINPDPEISQALLTAFAPLSGTSYLHPSVYESLQGRDLTPSPAPSDSWPISDPAQQFEARHMRDIETVRQLGRLRGRDQFVRALFVPLLAERSRDSAQSLIEHFSPFILSVDQNNVQQALTLLDTEAFDSLHARAPIAVELIASLVHHGGTLEEKARLLALIEPLALDGQFDQQRYALMYDRQAESEGRPQRYGTQDACVDGVRTLHPIEDEATVNERRAEMGMQPLAQYRQQLIEMYGATC